jgi:hypothetical protein
MSGSLTLGSSYGENASFFRSLSGSWTVDSSHVAGSLFTVTLQANFDTTVVLSGQRSGCSENTIVSCGIATAWFALLVIAFGFVVFGIYAAKQRRQSPTRSGGPKPGKVSVDEEGWEKKAED